MGSKLNVKLGENENGGSQLKHLNIQLSSDVWLHLPLTETCSPDNPLIGGGGILVDYFPPLMSRSVAICRYSMAPPPLYCQRNYGK